MFAIQQAILDQMFDAYTVERYPKLFEDRGWRTAEYFPGAASPPADPTRVHKVTIKADVPAFYGLPVAFAKDPARRPTGLYLSP